MRDHYQWETHAAIRVHMLISRFLCVQMTLPGGTPYLLQNLLFRCCCGGQKHHLIHRASKRVYQTLCYKVQVVKVQNRHVKSKEIKRPPKSLRREVSRQQPRGTYQGGKLSISYPWERSKRAAHM